MTGNPPHIFTIEGNIGAGKTTLTGQLAARLTELGKKVCVVPEPVDVWEKTGVLAAFYADPTKWAYKFQTFVFATRMMAIRQAFEQTPDADVYLLERGPATDRLFMELQGLRGSQEGDMQMRMYETWCGVFEKLTPFDVSKASVLYLRTTDAECMRRVRARHRGGEVDDERSASGANSSGVQIDYLRRLAAIHDAFYLDQGREAFPGLPRHPFKRVVEVSADIADSDFREGRDGGRAVEHIVSLMQRLLDHER